jgi:diguanylate cyclase (GGDEF)-like protein
MDRLETALARAERTGHGVAVLFSDIDHFKLVNDSLGHAVGDAVLQQLAARYRASARSVDTVARFGGDEFVVVCEDVEGIEHAIEIAQRLDAAVEEPMLVDRDQRIVTVSTGVALGRAGASPTGLLRDADAAMNLAKERRAGRASRCSATSCGATRCADSTSTRHCGWRRGGASCTSPTSRSW